VEKEPVALFSRVNDALLEGPVLKSWMYQLGMVNELLVQFEFDASCLVPSALGSATTNNEWLTERKTAKDAARVKAILCCT
jgi:hypothetical protein